MNKLKPIIIVACFIFLIFSLSQCHLKILSANWHLNQAEAALSKNNFFKAFAEYEKALEINSPTINPYVRYRYGQTALSYAKLTKYFDIELNKEIIKKAIDFQEENSKKEWPYFTRNYIIAGQLSNVLFEQGEENYAQKANYYFEKALQLSPKRANIYLEMAETEITEENYQRAETKIQKALEINNLNPYAFWKLLLLKIQEGKKQEAKELFLKLAMEFNYNLLSFESLNELALAYEKQGDFKKAIFFYQRLCHWSPFYQEKIKNLSNF